MRRSIVIGTILLVATVLLIGGPSLLFSPSTSDVAPETEDKPTPEIISFDDSDSGFWPYLNAREAHEQRSPLNVVVRGETETIVQLLTAYGGGDWEETDHDHFDTDDLVGFAQNESTTDDQIEPDSPAESTQEAATTETETETETETAVGSQTDTEMEATLNGELDADTDAEQESGAASGPYPDSHTAPNSSTTAQAETTAENDVGETSEDGDSSTGVERTEGTEPTETEPSNESEAGHEHALRPVSPTDIPWSQADGATRFAYLDPGPDDQAYWTTETLQLEDGEYYGYRYHIRLYESPNPDDQWVVMQTHSEHFDWFTLRHRVDGVEGAQSRLEQDLMAIPGVDQQEDLQRIYLDNSGPSDADGWATKVDLTFSPALVVPLLLGMLLHRRTGWRLGGGTLRSRGWLGLSSIDPVERSRDDGDLPPQGIAARISAELDNHLTERDRERLAAAGGRIEARHLILTGTILTIILGVRILGIAFDRTFSFMTVHMIAASLYPIIALGLPVGTYVIASGLERRLDAALAASGSLAVAIWLDYSLLGVDVLPLDVVVQRMLVVVALGLIAGGAARRATRESRFNDMLLVGASTWVLVLVGTLFGYL
ncbi:hypothetical protein C482_20531 [Natrialba chahannaoensis JCM 10990]|uniref:Uncharacterized protein n=1 Tax=Natrialba chahannaoensis JCM 10990 TaxID=1227492 RepID=M0A3E0_9EURY|nr:hypothetical protein [Natrialba chahannaoensis]ELY93099.1 hypothetical protein C482_20531 [Natrialba chahannaoensis JCM 10990]